MKTFKELYERKENIEESDSGLAAKAKKSGISLGTLKKVYKRGVAAWNSGHRPGTTPQQWGMARVNSYITKGKGTYHGADKDLREEKLNRVAKDKESGLPKKYVSGLSPSTAKARAAHWNKMDKLSDKDPAAYEPAPGDATAKTKESKHTKKYREMFEAVWDKPNSKKGKSKPLSSARRAAAKARAKRAGRKYPNLVDSMWAAKNEQNVSSFRKFISEATYQGKKVPLNKPMAGDVKKSKVFVDLDGDGIAQKVNFGDKNMTIKKNIPARRKSFRARHNCENPGPKNKARYWSCRAW